MEPNEAATLLENHRRFLAFVERRVGNRAEAEELLQSAFVRALEKGLPEGEGAVSWFYRVLRNALVDHFRHRGVTAKAVDESAQNRDAGVADPELKEVICGCVNSLMLTLKPEYAEVLRRVDLEEKPVSEVAQSLDITSNNASVRLHRARQALKSQLQKSCGACATHGCLDCTCKASAPELTLRPRG